MSYTRCFKFWSQINSKPSTNEHLKTWCQPMCQLLICFVVTKIKLYFQCEPKCLKFKNSTNNQKKTPIWSRWQQYLGKLNVIQFALLSLAPGLIYLLLDICGWEIGRCFNWWGVKEIPVLRDWNVLSKRENMKQ